MSSVTIIGEEKLRKIHHETRRFLSNITTYFHIICLLCIKISMQCFMLVGSAKPQHCMSPDILVEQMPKGPSQVDVTWLWAISVQSHINVVFLNLQLDSLINNSTERGVNFTIYLNGLLTLKPNYDHLNANTVNHFTADHCTETSATVMCFFPGLPDSVAMFWCAFSEKVLLLALSALDCNWVCSLEPLGKQSTYYCF